MSFINFRRNMNRLVTYWYTKDQPIFENTDDMADTRIDVARIPAGSDTPPCLKISHNTFETMEKANWEFLRLSLPVICQSIFITEGEKLRRWQEIKIRQNRLLVEQVEQGQQAAPSAHLEQIMKSGFSMSDIKGSNTKSINLKIDFVINIYNTYVNYEEVNNLFVKMLIFKKVLDKIKLFNLLKYCQYLIMLE